MKRTLFVLSLILVFLTYITVSQNAKVYAGENCGWCAGAVQCKSLSGHDPEARNVNACGGSDCCQGYQKDQPAPQSQPAVAAPPVAQPNSGANPPFVCGAGSAQGCEGVTPGGVGSVGLDCFICFKNGPTQCGRDTPYTCKTPQTNTAASGGSPSQTTTPPPTDRSVVKPAPNCGGGSNPSTCCGNGKIFVGGCVNGCVPDTKTGMQWTESICGITQSQQVQASASNSSNKKTKGASCASADECQSGVCQPLNTGMATDLKQCTDPQGAPTTTQTTQGRPPATTCTQVGGAWINCPGTASGGKCVAKDIDGLQIVTNEKACTDLKASETFAKNNNYAPTEWAKALITKGGDGAQCTDNSGCASNFCQPSSKTCRFPSVLCQQKPNGFLSFDACDKAGGSDTHSCTTTDVPNCWVLTKNGDNSSDHNTQSNTKPETKICDTKNECMGLHPSEKDGKCIDRMQNNCFVYIPYYTGIDTKPCTGPAGCTCDGMIIPAGTTCHITQKPADYTDRCCSGNSDCGNDQNIYTCQSKTGSSCATGKSCQYTTQYKDHANFITQVVRTFIFMTRYTNNPSLATSDCMKVGGFSTANSSNAESACNNKAIVDLDSRCSLHDTIPNCWVPGPPLNTQKPKTDGNTFCKSIQMSANPTAVCDSKTQYDFKVKQYTFSQDSVQYTCYSCEKSSDTTTPPTTEQLCAKFGFGTSPQNACNGKNLPAGSYDTPPYIVTSATFNHSVTCYQCVPHNP